MSIEANEDFFAVLSQRSIKAEIERHIFLTKGNRELAALGATLLFHALNILTILSPADTLKSAIIDALDERGDAYSTLANKLEALTVDTTVLE